MNAFKLTLRVLNEIVLLLVLIILSPIYFPAYWFTKGVNKWADRRMKKAEQLLKEIEDRECS